MNKKTYISLFSSAGVGCYGFKMENFECIATNELLENRLEIQKINNKCRYNSGYISGDITKEETKEKIFDEINKKENSMSKTYEILKNTTIYTLKKFSSAYQNLIKILEYHDGDVINIENVNFTAMIELLKVRDVITVMTQEYVEEKVAQKELSILDVGFSIPNAEYGIYYNINNKSQKINNLIKLFTSGVKV